jgi:hypothetical protein
MKNQIEIPKELVNFFKKRRGSHRGRYVPYERGLSYSEVVGRNAEEIPPELHCGEEALGIEEYMFSNLDDESKQNAEKASERVLRRLFGKKEYSSVKRSYMVGTLTLPVKVRFKEDGKKSKKIAYVKKPSIGRIVGRFLYEIVSGIKEYSFLFNENIFVEEGAHGNTLSRVDEQDFFDVLEYRKGIARAAVHAYVLGIEGESINPRNRVIDSKLRTILIDFEPIFLKRNPGDNVFFERYVRKKGFIDHAVINAYLEEHHLVSRRLEENWDCVFKLARITGNLVDITGRSFNERMRQWYDAGSLEEYLENTVYEFRQV